MKHGLLAIALAVSLTASAAVEIRMIRTMPPARVRALRQLQPTEGDALRVTAKMVEQKPLRENCDPPATLRTRNGKPMLAMSAFSTQLPMAGQNASLWKKLSEAEINSLVSFVRGLKKQVASVHNHITSAVFD